MSSCFCLSVIFLDPAPLFHGRTDGSEPEWPPSPLRLFRALVAAAGGWRAGPLAPPATMALQWLERQGPPTIIAPPGAAYTLSVPNNAMDVVARAWCRGNETNPDSQLSTHRALKPVRPTRLLGADQAHYLWHCPSLSPGTISLPSRRFRPSPGALSPSVGGWTWSPGTGSSPRGAGTPAAGRALAARWRGHAAAGGATWDAGGA